ncbi:hypothetical protein CMK19_00930 [Candidatus Poribacteria bacterium]|nr:hypothetical protein [Candidatus Poribacteria bacterium]
MSNPLGNVPLTLEQLLEHHKSICQEALDIMEKKNHDYCGGDNGDPFANFTRSEVMGICTAEQGFLVRICDKLSRLTTFVNQGTLKVHNESYSDAVLDIINYCVLFHAYTCSKYDPDDH